MPVPGTHTPASSPPLVTAFVVKAPTSPIDHLLVRVPEFGNAVSEAFSWSGRGGLPAIGDECLLAYDEKGNPWVAAWLTAPITPPLVSALPAEPHDGQEVYFQEATMAERGQVWHLRYRAAAAGAAKWEFVGGSPLGTGGFQGDITTTSATMVALAGGPTITLPLGGEYALDLSITIVATGAGYNIASVFAGASETACQVLIDGSAGLQWLSRGQSINYVAVAGTVLSVKVQSLAATNTRFVNAALSARPVRVG